MQPCVINASSTAKTIMELYVTADDRLSLTLMRGLIIHAI